MGTRIQRAKATRIIGQSHARRVCPQHAGGSSLACTTAGALQKGGRNCFFVVNETASSQNSMKGNRMSRIFISLYNFAKAAADYDTLPPFYEGFIEGLRKSGNDVMVYHFSNMAMILTNKYLILFLNI